MQASLNRDIGILLIPSDIELTQGGCQGLTCKGVQLEPTQIQMPSIPFGKKQDICVQPSSSICIPVQARSIFSWIGIDWRR